jgi:hypothetical protein
MFKHEGPGSMKRGKTPTFLLELPLAPDPGQAKHLRAHFEAARCLYNALLGEAMKRLRLLRADPRWQAARLIPRAQKGERQRAFSHLREEYAFSEYGMHRFAKEANCTWMADHLDAVTAQVLASRAYQAANRVCLGQAKKVRFRSRGRGLDSLEGKRNDTGIRFVLQQPEEGQQGWLVWGKDRLAALIKWDDPVVKHGLDHRIKYCRIVRRKASSPQAQGADCQGNRYSVQLILEGQAYLKEKNRPGKDVVGLDVGPSTIAIVTRAGQARLDLLCHELLPDARKKRRLQRKLDRQRRANNPGNYDEQGRITQQGKHHREWKTSRGYLTTRRRYATQERKLAAHRKSLHGQMVNEIIRLGNQIQLENLSYKSWQKQYGKSVGLRAPGMLIAHLKRTVARTGGILHEVPTRSTRLSQYCHGCQTYQRKPLTERWHHCSCGIGPVQRDLYSAFLLAYLHPPDPIPSLAQSDWEGSEASLVAAIEVLKHRAKAGESFPQSVGIPHARARLPKSLAKTHLELVFHRGS